MKMKTINLFDLSSQDFSDLLKLAREKEALEKKISDILARAKKRQLTETNVARSLRIPRSAQPNLRDLISEVLREAGKPLSTQAIYEATLAKGYHWRSKDPMNALNVKLYTDKVFVKVAPSTWSL